MIARARLILWLLVLLALVPAGLARAAEPDERVQTLVVYGADPCPKSADGSIVVCARRPESERYRIPKALRGKPPPPAEQAWGSRVEALDAASRAVLPNSCSPIGSNGFTGCTAAMLRQWYADRQRAAAEGAGR
ncbi:MAG TPA: hypothetical protein VL918_07400 [Sphingobium sp.]|nr:hypothetical protein [Sphingobium sp.]